MSKEASVAPKERVNIVYRPAEGAGQEEVELPMKLLVLGDFRGTPEKRPLERREPASVNKENFDAVMQGQGISLQLAVPNRLSGGADDELNIALNFEALSDFGPEAIIEKVPELRRILELREALRALKGPLANVPEFRRKLQDLVSDRSARARLLTELGVKEA
jgi:type VI secretion system protein ImpB